MHTSKQVSAHVSISIDAHEPSGCLPIATVPTCRYRASIATSSRPWVRRRLPCGVWRMVHGAWRMMHGAWRMAYGVWCGMWHMVHIMWFIACGAWGVACGVWRVACGVWRAMCGGVWCMSYGVRRIVYGVLYMAHGVWRTAHGVWYVAYGMRRMTYDVWRIAYGVWTMHGPRHIVYPESSSDRSADRAEKEAANLPSGCTTKWTAPSSVPNHNSFGWHWLHESRDIGSGPEHIGHRRRRRRRPRRAQAGADATNPDPTLPV